MNPRRLCSRAAAGVAAALVLLPASAAAQVREPEPSERILPLTLEEAVRRAVEHNPDLAIVRLDTQVDAARVGESRTAFTPLFSATFGRSSNTTPPSNFLSGDAGVELDDLFSTFGVRQRLPWGSGTWQVSWDVARTSTNSPISNFDPSLQSGFEVAFSQPLLRDRSVDQARYQYAIAKRNLESSELRFRESVIQTVAAVKQAYWTLKATQANIAVAQRSLELAEELARQTKIRVDAGQIPPLDLSQAGAEVAQRRENLIRAHTAAGDAEDSLRRLIMDPSDESFWQMHLQASQELTPPGPVPDVSGAVTRALGERYDIARAGRQLENARTTVEYLGNQRLPDVRLETSWRGNGLGGTQFLRTGGFPGVITGTRSSGLGDALGQVFRSDYPAWSVGVTVHYPLGQSYEEAGMARAQVESRQAEQRIASLRVRVAEAVRRAGRHVRSTAERIDAARAGASLAQERLDAEQRRYEAGLSTTFLVTQAQRDLLQAQVNLLQTTLDYESALVNFEAIQQAPPLAEGDTVAVQGASIVPLPAPTPRGVFRSNASGLQ